MAGAGNGFTVRLVRHRQTKETVTDRHHLRDTAPVLDPTLILLADSIALTESRFKAFELFKSFKALKEIGAFRPFWRFYGSMVQEFKPDAVPSSAFKVAGGSHRYSTIQFSLISAVAHRQRCAPAPWSDGIGLT